MSATTDNDWVVATTTFEQVLPNEWEWYVTWNDRVSDRRVPFRPSREGEERCDLVLHQDAICALPASHPGPHVPVSTNLAKMPFIIAP